MPCKAGFGEFRCNRYHEPGCAAQGQTQRAEAVSRNWHDQIGADCAAGGTFSQLVAKDADYAVKMIIDAMTEALATGDRIEIRGFGSFALNYRPPRVGRNPKSGEKVHVPEKYVPHFKAGKELRERVDIRE